MPINRRNLLAGAGAAALVPALVRANGTSIETRTGIILVGAGWCPVCKQAAPILALIAQQRDLPVLVATEDNRPIPPFPNCVPSEGNRIAAPVTAYPTTFVYSAALGDIVGGFEGYRNQAWYAQSLLTLITRAEALT